MRRAISSSARARTALALRHFGRKDCWHGSRGARPTSGGVHQADRTFPLARRANAITCPPGRDTGGRSSSGWPELPFSCVATRAPIDSTLAYLVRCSGVCLRLTAPRRSPDAQLAGSREAQAVGGVGRACRGFRCPDRGRLGPVAARERPPRRDVDSGHRGKDIRLPHAPCRPANCGCGSSCGPLRRGGWGRVQRVRRHTPSRVLCGRPARGRARMPRPSHLAIYGRRRCMRAVAATTNDNVHVRRRKRVPDRNTLRRGDTVTDRRRVRGSLPPHTQTPAGNSAASDGNCLSRMVWTHHGRPLTTPPDPR